MVFPASEEILKMLVKEPPIYKSDLLSSEHLFSVKYFLTHLLSIIYLMNRADAKKSILPTRQKSEVLHWYKQPSNAIQTTIFINHHFNL